MRVRLQRIPEAWGHQSPLLGIRKWVVERQPRGAMAQGFLLSVPCPLFFQLLPWPLAMPTSTTPWQCPPGEEPNLVSLPCPPALS